MRALWIWAAAIALYGLFALWYDNWSGPLATEEIEIYLARLEETDRDPERLARMRAFLEADDGGEFFMVNLIRLHEGEVSVPGSGEPARPAAEVLGVYTGYVLPAMFRRAGHPAFFASAAGGYVDDWGVEADPGWTAAGVVRYRSRRDLMEMATDPAFEPAHAYKIAAMASTLAFPAAPIRIFVGPRVWVGLGIALLAALAQLALGARRT